MERFVLLKLYDKQLGEDAERWFNLRMIRQFDPDKNEVLLQGSSTSLKVTVDSMDRLVEMVRGLNRTASYTEECSYHDVIIKRLMHKVADSDNEMPKRCGKGFIGWLLKCVRWKG